MTIKETPDAFEHSRCELLAYQKFRRGLRRLDDAKDLIVQAIALLERANHPLGPVKENREPMNGGTS